ncbi:MAG: hypothetical protein KIT46_02555 [Anaerolineales bacterium]|nr:hypothetical protein [Anaerolineales bacterium]MCW5854907.1 hypothetical protein [Anaerolineales bacterium]
MAKYNDFAAFYQDFLPVEGGYGPKPVLPPFLKHWLGTAFAGGVPAARTILDGRTKKQGKSTLAAAVGLFMAVRTPGAECAIVSNDQDQSRDRIFRSAKFAVQNGPLAEYAKVYRDVIEFENGATIKAFAADWKGAAGGNYSCVLVDELHSFVHEGQRRLWDEMVVSPVVSDGVRWVASYAGWLGESELLFELWNKALAGEKLANEFDLPIHHNKAAGLLALIDTGEASWRMPWMTAQYMAEEREKTRPNTFRRLWLNEWVANEARFVDQESWDACYSPDVKPYSEADKRRMVLGVDASTTRDLTALVGVSEHMEVVHVRTWKPRKGLLRGGKPTVDLGLVKEEILKLYGVKVVDAVYYDPMQMHSIAVELEQAGVPMVELPQTGKRVEADQALYDAVVNRSIKHYNDPVLNEHIRNAIAVETPRGFRIAKEKTSLKIDAAVALSMAHYGAAEEYIRNVGSPGEFISNPFYYDGEPFKIICGARVAYGTERHKPGVTWKTCRRRNGNEEGLGCEACVRELEAEGYYEQHFEI